MKSEHEKILREDLEHLDAELHDIWFDMRTIMNRLDDCRDRITKADILVEYGDEEKRKDT